MIDKLQALCQTRDVLGGDVAALREAQEKGRPELAAVEAGLRVLEATYAEAPGVEATGGKSARPIRVKPDAARTHRTDIEHTMCILDRQLVSKQQESPQAEARAAEPEREIEREAVIDDLEDLGASTIEALDHLAQLIADARQTR